MPKSFPTANGGASMERAGRRRPGPTGQSLSFERVGIDRIEEESRTSTPWTFFVIIVGSSATLASTIYGWIPITFGLDVWGAVSSIVVGTAVGIAALLPLILVGSRTATNNATSSGAHFGVRGRIIGSTVGLVITAVSAAVVIWTSGSATVSLSSRLFDTANTDAALAVAYGLIALLTALVAIYGYHLLVRVAWVLMIAGGLVVLAMPIAFSGDIDLGYQGGDYLLGSYGSTWLLAALTVGVSGVLQIGTLVGDWTRYISPRRHSTAKLASVASLGVFVGYVVPMSIGAVVATAFVDPTASFPENLAGNAPIWFAMMLLPFALLGGLAWAATGMYSSGLDLESLVPRLSRAGATSLAGTVSVGLVFLGSLVWDAADSIATASLVVLALIAPWAAIMGIGYLRRRGAYLPDDLQVFNRGQRGGAYWFSGGWNWRAVAAWCGGSLFGLLALQTAHYVGPLANLAGGVDVSFVGSYLIAGILFLLFDVLAPAPAAAVDGASVAR